MSPEESPEHEDIAYRFRFERNREELQPEELDRRLSLREGSWLQFEEREERPSAEVVIAAADVFIKPPQLWLRVAGYEAEAESQPPWRRQNESLQRSERIRRREEEKLAKKDAAES